jgi:hypothetical protein
LTLVSIRRIVFLFDQQGGFFPMHQFDETRDVIIDPMTGIVLDVNPDAVTSVYTGRAGCACGCRGKHRRRDDASFFRVINNILNTGECIFDDRYRALAYAENDKHLKVIYFE